MPSINEIKGFLIDLDGTLYVGEEAVLGTPRTLGFLREKYPLRFISNTTSKTKDAVLEKLRKMGFSIEKKEVFTALEAIRSFLEKEKKGAYLLLSDKAREELSFIPGSPVDYVVVGHARKNFIYENINQAFRYLMEGAQLIAAARTRYYQDQDGRLSLDGGAFVAALEYASGKKARIMGKPAEDFFLQAVESMGLLPEQVAMVGDDIDNDVLGAMEAGLTGILVKTGKFWEEDLKRAKKPDYVLSSLNDLPKLLGF